jgi:hypothetical protein
VIQKGEKCGIKENMSKYGEEVVVKQGLGTTRNPTQNTLSDPGPPGWVRNVV